MRAFHRPRCCSSRADRDVSNEPKRSTHSVLQVQHSSENVVTAQTVPLPLHGALEECEDGAPWRRRREACVSSDNTPRARPDEAATFW